MGEDGRSILDEQNSTIFAPQQATLVTHTTVSFISPLSSFVLCKRLDRHLQMRQIWRTMGNSNGQWSLGMFWRRLSRPSGQSHMSFQISSTDEAGKPYQSQHCPTLPLDEDGATGRYSVTVLVVYQESLHFRWQYGRETRMRHSTAEELC